MPSENKLKTEYAKPFLLKPAVKDYLWGGDRLKTEFGKVTDVTPLAETWECSTHPDGSSMVCGGDFNGKLLSEVLREHPEYLGSHPIENSIDGRPELPILIKFIDAKQDLSVQVHPDDEYAYAKENGQRGKTEMWYVLDAVKGAKLTYGFQFALSASECQERIEDGTIEKFLQKVPVEANDVFFIESGTVHAIGTGTLIAEIQENSNLTYRMYDYDRIDKNGNKRELHIEKALEVANLAAGVKPKQSMRVLRYRKGCAKELLGRCKYFEVYRMLLNARADKLDEHVSFRSDEESFRVLLCIDGSGFIDMEDGDRLPFNKGDCIFVPAKSMGLRLCGRAQMLDVRG